MCVCTPTDTYTYPHVQAMKATIPRYNPSLYDQMGLVWVLHKHQDWVPHVHFEHKHEFGFHFHYRADLPLDRLGDKSWMHPLILHYAGTYARRSGVACAGAARWSAILQLVSNTQRQGPICPEIFCHTGVEGTTVLVCFCPHARHSFTTLSSYTTPCAQVASFAVMA